MIYRTTGPPPGPRDMETGLAKFSEERRRGNERWEETKTGGTSEEPGTALSEFTCLSRLTCPELLEQAPRTPLPGDGSEARELTALSLCRGAAGTLVWLVRAPPSARGLPSHLPAPSPFPSCWGQPAHPGERKVIPPGVQGSSWCQGSRHRRL